MVPVNFSTCSKIVLDKIWKSSRNRRVWSVLVCTLLPLQVGLRCERSKPFYGNDSLLRNSRNCQSAQLTTSFLLVAIIITVINVLWHHCLPVALFTSDKLYQTVASCQRKLTALQELCFFGFSFGVSVIFLVFSQLKQPTIGFRKVLDRTNKERRRKGSVAIFLLKSKSKEEVDVTLLLIFFGASVSGVFRSRRLRSRVFLMF